MYAWTIWNVSLPDCTTSAFIRVHKHGSSRASSLFFFLIMADYLEADPSELLEGPKIGLKLPEVLTVEEIDSIIAAIDLSKNEGQRNRRSLKHCTVAVCVYRN